MKCKNHPDADAGARCPGCQEAFCGDCLVQVGGQRYCGACKVMALQGRPHALGEEGLTMCATASEGLTFSVVGFLFLGFIFAPLAIVRAVKARREIAADPRLMGSGKVLGAQILAFIGLALWVIGIIGRTRS